MRFSTRLTCAVAAAGFVCALSGPALAGVAWDEAVDGDLSGEALSPTVMTLGLGSNIVRHNVESGDFDYFTFNIPAGQQLEGIYLKAFDSPDGDVQSFMSILDGATFTVTPSDAFGDPDLLKGWLHVSPFINQPDENMLLEMGLSPLLPAGDYSFWTSQTGFPSDVEYDFVVVPEPSALALAGLGGLALLRRRR